jgi:hypothetical protein
LVLRLEVPLAKSSPSTSATERPRVAASRAAPAPVAPPARDDDEEEEEEDTIDR